MSQATLVRVARSTKTTISNICNNTNGKKGKYKKTYTPDIDTVEMMSRAWGLDDEQTNKLFDIAFPKFKHWKICNKMNLTIDESNDLMYSADPNMSLLGAKIKD